MNQNDSLARIWELAKEEHPKLILAIVLALIGVIAGIVPFIAGARIIIAMLAGVDDFNLYLKLCLIALIAYVIKTLFYTLALSKSHEAAFSALKTIRQKLLAKLPKFSLGTILDTSSGKLKQIIVDHVASMETTLAHILPEFTSNIVGPICVLIYIFILDWRMALITLIPIILGFSSMGLMMINYENDFKGAVDATTSMTETVVEYINGIEVIKAFSQGEKSYKKFKDKVIGNASYYYNWMKRCQLPQAMAFAIAPATMISVLPLGYIFMRNGTLSSNNFIMIIILALSIVGPIIKAMSFGDSLGKISTIVASVDDILNAKEQEHPTKNVEIKNSNIELKDVSFAYHDDQEILHDINLSIPANSLTAIVGPSGSGKSTIAKLIAGFFDVDKGQIKLAGVDLKDIPLNQLYDNVAFVTQENFLFDDTVLENIRMGNVKASDEEVILASKNAGCDEFISKLDQAYQTRVGSLGTHLSGGERQRIAIARAILKDAPIIILDEATAYIDPENEVIIQKALANLVKDKTVIIIAHRLSTITNADQIVVVEDGRIIANDKHDKLLKECELYKDMWQAHIGVKEGEIAC